MKVFNLIPLALCLSFSVPSFATQRALTIDDIMQFETLQQPVISDNGKVIAVQATPDRGDSRALVRFSDNSKRYQIDHGSNVKVSADGRFVLADIEPPLFDRETEKSDDLPHSVVLLATDSGTTQQFDEVESTLFSDNGAYLLIKHKPVKDDEDAAQALAAQTNEPSTDEQTKPDVDEKDVGTNVTLIKLATSEQITLNNVTKFAFDKAGNYVAVLQNKHQVHQMSLVKLESLTSEILYDSNSEQLESLAISPDGRFVALTKGDASVARYGREHSLLLLDTDTKKSQIYRQDNGWSYNQYSSLQFSKDNQRLFVGRVASVAQQAQLPKYNDAADVVNPEIITAQKQLRIWHGDDPKIKPQEVKEYAKELKRTYLAVLHLQTNNMVQLADESVPDVAYGEQRDYLVASSDVPYQKMITWAGFYRDVYLVDLNTGNKQLILAQQPSDSMPTLSPHAKFLAYFKQGGVYLFDISSGRSINLTHNISTPFADEDHDYPIEAPGYGFGPWLGDDSGITVYDKYDMWQFDTSSHQGFMLTKGDGRKSKTQFRVVGLAKEKRLPAVISQGQKILLQGYSHSTKADTFYRATVGKQGVTALTEGDGKLTLLARSTDADTVVFSKQRYDLYPDLYSANINNVQNAIQITELDTQRNDFAWGRAELVHWRDGDGVKMDGVLIKPANYQVGKAYPTMVYFYRFMSDRLHAFPDMKLNHRPNFAWYADNGYAIFLPDIRFEIGYPGISSVKALTAGVQKIIEMGVADPNAVGIQGHSWGGYQSAYAVTQTNIFKAVVTGAPVSNMTSAYSGIRHGSGLARQFQYETGQSRIGASLFAAPQKYVENSPIFYADRIQTPMMIMFGDKDDAVPWEQGVELYLAMRRAGKDVVFLQYQDEPHHLKKYPNKLDYSIKMKQYFDHYLKGAPAPTWLSQGEAYQEYKKAD